MNRLHFLLTARFLLIAARTHVDAGAGTLVVARLVRVLNRGVVELRAGSHGLDGRQLGDFHAAVDGHIVLAGRLDCPLLDRDQ